MTEKFTSPVRFHRGKSCLFFVWRLPSADPMLIGLRRS
jgi:hypothetical protein